MDVIGRLHQRVVRAGIEPRDAAPELFDVELSALEVGAIHIGDLELAARGRLEPTGNVNDLIVIEVQPGDREP